ncbi:AI-2E family transporter YdiK [Buchnera aphidicola (Macrosiphoniella sanborni)]|uniref:AI-2E family transporter YdiK n=1 Tax=Buchnera aphidicola (Macrosiphoniella sanborni) TaxID=1241865 RepID=A0A4D6YB51_9GAMM|nr:AI-2E family transporter YdiK [Buchnera aphidicola]QCI23681.1 AI-2E family transporter YdiK [Buchnera aphidicola (Macrosiphoniella sanborni)]
MQNSRDKIDLSQSILSLIFIISMGVVSFLVIKPFILGFSWASMIVIATWPLMLKIQNFFGGKRALAVLIMIIILLLLFIIPVFFLVKSLIATSIPLIHWLSSNTLEFPELEWLQDIPLIGKKIFISYQELLDSDGRALIREIKPYMGRTTEFFIIQVKNCGLFFIHLILMLFFSALLYWNGEKISEIVKNFAYRLSKKNGYAIVLLATQAVRAVALGVAVTALIQALLSGIGLLISGVPYWALLMIIIFFSCLIQLGPLPILIPSIIWLYWNNNTTWGTILLIWSCLVFILDHILRPFFIRIGADLPILLILSGVIGGLLIFGMIGLFIGPIVLVIFYRLIISWTYGISLASFLEKIHR